MGKTIMAVDDSASIRQMVSFALREGGYQVVEASDGMAALAKLDGENVDMIIADLNMPNLDGIGLVREVRSMASCRFLPIIILTTESQESRKQAAREAGASGWIVKPFTPNQLVSVVKRVIG
jgi:two-component system chemotaxis response regulator CheY